MKKPNIVLISIDTLRADHVSCYGYERKTTPCLDQLAEEGILFENSYSTGVWTPPGHGSMLTGLHPCQHGATGKNRLRKSVPTLAEILQNNGYRTVGLINNPQVGELVGFDRGHEIFCEVWRGVRARTVIDRGVRFIHRKALSALHRLDKGAKKTTDLAIKWLGENAKSGYPFYLFIHFIEPHNPLHPPEPYRSSFLKEIDQKGVNRDKIDLIAENPLICLTDGIMPTYEELQIIKALYDAEIAYTDSQINYLFDYLKQLKIYDQTLIIVTSDHGEHFGEHGLFSHVASLYEPVLRVPLIMRYPDVFRAGTRDQHLTQIIDILPTVIEITHLDFGVENNHSLCKSLASPGGPYPYHDFIVAEWEGRVPSFVESRFKQVNTDCNLDRYTRNLTMIRENDLKYILASDGSEQLFDLRTDPEETSNIALTKPDIKQKLYEKLFTWKELVIDDSFKEEEQGPFDAQIISKLKSLGYL